MPPPTLQCFNKTVDGQANLELTDGVIFLRPLRAEEAAAHLAGEDEDIAKWLSGGRSTLDNVKAYIERTLENWRTGAPRRAFGVFDCASGQLIGSIEVNLARVLEPAQVNVSYGIYRQWRGLGLAQHALDLMNEYLRASTNARQIVLRIAPANRASIRVAEKGGFTYLGTFDEPEGPMARYIRDVR
jgi:RimJ/RimL family protein N-acetyltransferase